MSIRADRDPDAEDDEGAPPSPARNPILVGHQTAEQALLDAYRSRRLPHAWLIGGPEGIGKATLAWRFARFVLAHPDPGSEAVLKATDLAVSPDHPAAQRIAAGSHGDVAILARQWNDKTKKRFSDIRVDDVRRTMALFQRASGSGGYRVCIIDTADDLNRSSANALLKIIEEPPQHSLFLILAHRPGQVMPTIVSRCRRLTLAALSDGEVIAAIGQLGPDWAALPPARVADAAARSRGSVARALELLAGDTLDLDAAVLALLSAVPSVDWRRVHALADRLGPSGDKAEVVLGAVFDWLSAGVETGAASQPLATLVRRAEAWERIRRVSREADVLNLDKRALLLTVFAELAQLPRGA